MFLGTPEKHRYSNSTVGHVPYLETKNLLQAAEVISASECFVGNQSCLYAIAEGMKHNALLEVWPGNPDCLFQRKNVYHGHDDRTTYDAIERVLAGMVTHRCD